MHNNNNVSRNSGGRRKRGRPWKNWPGTISEDLKYLEMSWEEVEQLAMSRDEWRRCIARCADLHGKD